MRRVASGIAIALVAAVAASAAIDAVREGLEPEPSRAEAAPRPIDGLTLLSGRLVWIDARCRLHVTSLATLEEPRRPRRVSCRARLLPSGEVGRRDGASRRLRSPSGELLAVAGPAALRILKDGRLFTLPIAEAAALAWSADERWLAAAGRREVHVVRVLNRDMRIRRLPIAATQIAWLPG